VTCKYKLLSYCKFGKNAQLTIRGLLTQSFTYPEEKKIYVNSKFSDEMKPPLRSPWQYSYHTVEAHLCHYSGQLPLVFTYACTYVIVKVL